MSDSSRCEGYIQFQHQGKFSIPAAHSKDTENLDKLTASTRFGLLLLGCGDELVFISVAKLADRFDEKGMALLDGQGGQYEVGRAKIHGGIDISGVGLSSSEKYVYILCGNTVSIYTLAALFEDCKKGVASDALMKVHEGGQATHFKNSMCKWSKLCSEDCLLVVANYSESISGNKSHANAAGVVVVAKPSSRVQKTAAIDQIVHACDWSPSANEAEAIVLGLTRDLLVIQNVENTLAAGGLVDVQRKIPLLEDDERDVKSLCHVNWFEKSNLCVAYLELLDEDILPSVALCKIDAGASMVTLVKDLEDEVCSGDSELGSPMYRTTWVAESKCLLVASSSSNDVHVIRVDLEDTGDEEYNPFVIEGDDAERLTLIHDGDQGVEPLPIGIVCSYNVRKEVKDLGDSTKSGPCPLVLTMARGGMLQATSFFDKLVKSREGTIVKTAIVDAVAVPAPEPVAIIADAKVVLSPPVVSVPEIVPSISPEPAPTQAPAQINGSPGFGSVDFNTVNTATFNPSKTMSGATAETKMGNTRASVHGTVTSVRNNDNSLVDMERIREIANTLSMSLETLNGDGAGDRDESMDAVRELVTLTRKYRHAVSKISEDVEKGMKTMALNMEAELKALTRRTSVDNREIGFLSGEQVFDNSLEMRRSELSQRVTALREALDAKTESIGMVVNSSRAPVQSREGILNALTQSFKLARQYKQRLESLGGVVETETAKLKPLRLLANTPSKPKAETTARGRSGAHWRALARSATRNGFCNSKISNGEFEGMTTADRATEELEEDYTIVNLLQKSASREGLPGTVEAVAKSSIKFDSEAMVREHTLSPPKTASQSRTIGKQHPASVMAPSAFGAAAKTEVKPEVKKSSQPPIPTTAPSAFGAAAKPTPKSSQPPIPTTAPSAFGAAAKTEVKKSSQPPIPTAAPSAFGAAAKPTPKSSQPPIPTTAPSAFGAAAKPEVKKSSQPPIPTTAPSAFGAAAKPEAKPTFGGLSFGQPPSKSEGGSDQKSSGMMAGGGLFGKAGPTGDSIYGKPTGFGASSLLSKNSPSKPAWGSAGGASGGSLFRNNTIASPAPSESGATSAPGSGTAPANSLFRGDGGGFGGTSSTFGGVSAPAASGEPKFPGTSGFSANTPLGSDKVVFGASTGGSQTGFSGPSLFSGSAGPTTQSQAPSSSPVARPGLFSAPEQRSEVSTNLFGNGSNPSTSSAFSGNSFKSFR